jgi:DNA-binding transcriptional ArsR family regulator
MTESNNNSSKSNSTKIDAIAIKKAGLLIRSINHKLRQAIMKLLDDNNKMTVTEIYVKLRVEQSVASQHLAILRKHGFVFTTRDGKNIYYFANNEKLNYVQNAVQVLITEKK